MSDGKLSVDFGVWGVIRKVAVVLVVLGLLGGLALWYIPILKQTQVLEREIKIKTEAINKQKETYRRYSDEIVALRNDPEAVEREARLKLNLAKPNETIYHFETPRSDR
jgi:cell division protein FtsB